jgi:hypothetical protein
MTPIILDSIPLSLDRKRLLDLLHLQDDTDDALAATKLADEAVSLGRPKAVCGVAYVDDKADDSVVIDGVRFRSRILRVNLDPVHRVFPYIATCGTELEAWASHIDDMLTRWWADSIMQMALAPAMDAVSRYIESELGPGKTARMNPGSLSDWPISEQRPLWTLLCDPTSLIGVRLTDSFLMIPAKSVTGIQFPSEVTYENCQLCPRAICPGRRAPYDKTLYDAKYRKA